MASSPMLENIVPELLTTKEAAQLLNIGERSLCRYSHDGTAPVPVRINGTAVRYRRSDLLAWIAAGCPKVVKEG